MTTAVLGYGVLVSTLVGAVGTGVLVQQWRTEAAATSACEPDFIGDCLGSGWLAVLAGPLVVVALVWLGLRIVGTERAGLGAALGAAATTGALLLEQATRPRSGPPDPELAAVLAGVGFAAGAAVAGARLPVVGRAALALLMVLPVGLFPTVRRDTRRADLEQRLVRLGFPLLVPRPAGYRLVAAHVDDADRVLTLNYHDGDRYLSVRLLPAPVGFAPPARCGPTEAALGGAGGGPPQDGPCTAVGPDHWVRVEYERPVHLLRRDGVLVLLVPGYGTPESDASAAIATVGGTTPRRLAEQVAR